MGFRFRKSVRVAPGVRLNLGAKGATSLTVGGRGLRVTTGAFGTRVTSSVPGTGVSYTETIRPAPSVPPPAHIASTATVSISWHDRLRDRAFWGRVLTVTLKVLAVAGAVIAAAFAIMLTVALGSGGRRRR